MNPIEPNNPTFIDLFCGCGGFSLGLQRAGFRCLAAIDSNKEAIATFKANFGNEPLVMVEDLEKYKPEKLAEQIGRSSVDIIIGGPPCQGFSNARQVDAANHGPRVRKDGRRYLFRRYLDFVEAFDPKIFVIENVLGMQTAAKGKFFTMVQAEARKLGYRVQAQVEESWKLGVPQKRRRQLIIGVKAEIAGYFPNELKPALRVKEYPNPKLWDAIGDLPALCAGEGDEEQDYDLQRRFDVVASRGGYSHHYLYKVLEVGKSTNLRLTGHVLTVRGICVTSSGCSKGNTAERPKQGELKWSLNIVERALRTVTNDTIEKNCVQRLLRIWGRMDWVSYTQLKIDHLRPVRRRGFRAFPIGLLFRLPVHTSFG